MIDRLYRKLKYKIILYIFLYGDICIDVNLKRFEVIIEFIFEEVEWDVSIRVFMSLS